MATLHARLAPGMETEPALAAMKRVLREHFHISHATIQIDDGACAEGDCHGDGRDSHGGHHPGHHH